MALLVHHSFPDENELANGVAVIDRNSEWSRDINMVTQAGAVSVTNPQGGSVPEEVVVTMYSFGRYAQRIRQSNLVPLGATVMQWDDDCFALGELLVKVGEEFALTTGRDEFVLETEFKKLAPDGKLVVKQVREIPQADDTPSVILNVAQRSEGSRSRSRDTSHSMPRSFGCASGRHVSPAHESFLMGTQAQ
ncbi:MAG TPA: hypothetical protein VLI39_18945 [Sedimentisphaerales bacterium]|nr:hypothetical protein [Sedimentisphaerales bacterium]